MLFPFQMLHTDNVHIANNGCQVVSFVKVSTMYDGKSKYTKRDSNIQNNCCKWLLSFTNIIKENPDPQGLQYIIYTFKFPFYNLVCPDSCRLHI